MAKRVPKDEPAFNPLDPHLVNSVVNRSNTQIPNTEDREESRQQVAVLESPSKNSAEKPETYGQEPVVVSSRPTVIPPDMDKRDREKRVLLNRREERDIERLVTRVATELNTPVKLSHLLRAGITMLFHAEEEIIDRCKRIELVRPGNGNKPELEEFEHGVAEILSGAFREARSIR